MKILLTGSHGYVGSLLRRRLLKAGHTVTPIDVQWFYQDDIPPMDVRALRSIGDAECIIHLAAIANDPSVSFYPRRSWETGVLATMRLAEMAQVNGTRFIYASSVSVYGASRGLVTEGMELRPLSDYNKTKMAAERVLMSYTDVPVQIVRPATICGLAPRMRLDLTVNMLTVQALRDGNMTINGGDQFRPSIHIDDMCDLYLWLLDNPDKTGIYNAGWENCSLRELAEQVQWVVKDAKITNTGQTDPRSYQVNSDKLLNAGFRPKKVLNHAIHELVAAWNAGKLEDKPQWYNLPWMQSQGIKDE